MLTKLRRATTLNQWLICIKGAWIMNMLPLCLSRNWEQTEVHFPSLQLSSVGEPVPDPASHFCSWLKEAEHDVVLWYCSQSASRLDVIWILRYFSIRTAWWSEFIFLKFLAIFPECAFLLCSYVCLHFTVATWAADWIKPRKRRCAVAPRKVLGEFICTFDLTQCRSHRLWSIGE